MHQFPGDDAGCLDVRHAGGGCCNRALAINRVPEAIKAVKSHAMNEVFAKELRDLNPESRQLLERMMDYMERRCISIPMQAAKEVAQ